MTRSLPELRAVRAASSMAYVLPTPAAAPKKILRHPRSSAPGARETLCGSGLSVVRKTRSPHGLLLQGAQLNEGAAIRSSSLRALADRGIGGSRARVP